MDTKVRTVKQLKDLVSVVYKFLGEKHVVFLDSAQSNDDYSRFSYLTCDPFLVVSAKGNTVDINRLGKL